MLLGAVDLGSNSFRVEIGRLEGDSIHTQNYLKETVRLAGGFDDKGALTPEIQARALAALARFNERLAGLPSTQVRAVGTQAMRVATNAADFLKKAEETLGYRIDILSGHEEARLVFKGCAHTLPLSDKRRLVVDIGGASTEIIIGKGLEAQRYESFRMGCVNTSIRFFREGKITQKSLDRAITACAAELEESITTFGRGTYDECYGSAGTFGAVSDICRTLGWNTDGEVTPEHLERLRKMLLDMRDVKDVNFPGLKEDRREVIAGGLAVLSAVYRVLGIREMRPAQGALRMGLLYDLLGRVSNRDTRDVAIEGLMTATRIDREQAERVANITLAFYRELCPDASPELLRYLRWAALVHECGMSISSSRYHRHGEYIIKNADMPGFSRREQDMMAAIVLSQRGNLKKLEGAFSSGLISRAAALAIRLAVIFCHARKDVELPIMTIHRSNEQLVVRLAEVWLNAHPLTDYLLKEESDCWDRVGRSVKIEKF